jgi:hypothetical protein
MAGQAPAPGGAVVTAKPKSGKPSLADVLAKNSRGEKLTHQERGVLGASKRNAKRKIMPAETNQNLLLEADLPAPLAAAPAAAGGDNLLLAADAPAPIEAGGLVLSAADSKTIRDAAEAILDTMDTTTKAYIGYEARLAGADEKTVAAYESAVALNSRNRDLMAENSGPVVLALCKFFHCGPDKLAATLKNSAFLVGLFAHVTSVAATVKSIRESRAERAANPVKP